MNSEDAIFGAPLAFSAQGNAEEATLDGEVIGNSQEIGKAADEHQCWTLNTGGLGGVWRLINVLKGMDAKKRPKLVHLQETSCDGEQWKTVERHFKTIGFKAYHTMGTLDSKPAYGAWKRGIITAVSEGLKSKWMEEYTWRNGQFHAIEVHGVMCLNSYVKPSEDCIQRQLHEMQSFMTKTRWEGRWLCGGDWNEEWGGSWTSTFASLFEGYQQETCPTTSSRWDSSSLIDYWFSNFDIGKVDRRDERISDHCIITTKVDFGTLLDEEYTRFVQEKQFRCPSWMSPHKWHLLFQEAFELGEKLEWYDAIIKVEEMEWPEEVEEKDIINYQWATVCSKITWALSVASGYALNSVPADFEDYREIQSVVDVANCRKVKGVTIKLQKRVLQKRASRVSLAMRKLYKRAGRLSTLAKSMLRNRVDTEVINLQKKLFPHLAWSELSRTMVREELDRVKHCISEKEASEKKCSINSWKRRMHKGMKERSNWINKQGSQKSPMVADDQCAKTRQEGASKLRSYWQNLWQKQVWDDEERKEKAKNIADSINAKVIDKVEGARPSLEEFKKGLKRISGTHGIDGWSACELKAIAAVDKAAEMVWEAMELWEQTGIIPDCIAHCKLVCVPKKDRRRLSPNEYRPICVMSSLWRAWSSTWIRTGCIADWISKLFPSTIAGGIPGSHGPETLAAVLDHQVHMLHHGVSLDFRHAFDTIDLGLMLRALQQSVPECMQLWLNLVFSQWMNMSRWIIFDGCSDPEALVTKTGLPQGDPASPLIMNVLMWHCMQEVNKACNDPSLFHVTYMDDRTMAASSPDTICVAEEEWNRLAAEFHLLENRDKAQHVNVNNFETMEVLGSLIGRPLPMDDKASKATKRLEAAATRYRRVSFMPLRHQQKLLTANVFARSGLEYGWIASNPTDHQLKAQEIWLWKCLGRTSYTSPHMRSVLVGANSHMRFMLLKKRLRLLAKRNAALSQMGLPIGRTSLDQLVEDSLFSYGWQCIEQFWTHTDFELGFKVSELTDEIMWRKVSHNIRESYRKLAFEGLVQSGRHDANEINVPYSGCRRKLALKWAGEDFSSFMLVAGGMASPFQRNLLGYSDAGYCSICGEHAPGWEHIWLCANGFIPEDGLLKRFLWPRTVADFPLCSAFHKTFVASCC